MVYATLCIITMHFFTLRICVYDKPTGKKHRLHSSGQLRPPGESRCRRGSSARNTGGTAQASSGRRENPAAVADPLREIPAQATGRLQTDQKVETLRPPQLVQAAEDPRRKAGRLQTSSGRRSESRCRRQIHAGSWKATDRIRPAQATAGVPLPL